MRKSPDPCGGLRGSGPESATKTESPRCCVAELRVRSQGGAYFPLSEREAARTSAGMSSWSTASSLGLLVGAGT